MKTPALVQLSLAGLLAGSLAACAPAGDSDSPTRLSVSAEPVEQPAQAPTAKMDDLVVNPEFDFSSRREILLEVSLTTANNNPAAFRRVSIAANSIENSNVLAVGQTDQNGFFSSRINLPADVTAITVAASIMGKHNRKDVLVDSDHLVIRF